MSKRTIDPTVYGVSGYSNVPAYNIPYTATGHLMEHPARKVHKSLCGAPAGAARIVRRQPTAIANAAAPGMTRTPDAPHAGGKTETITTATTPLAAQPGWIHENRDLAAEDEWLSRIAERIAENSAIQDALKEGRSDQA